METSDADLVRGVLKGDVRASNTLVRRWSARISGYCHARLGRGDVLDVVVQEVFLRGFAGLSTLKNADRFGMWLRGIAHRVCLDWIKSRRRRVGSLDGEHDGRLEVADEREPSPDAPIEQAEEIAELMRTVESLPETYREVLMIYYYDDVTYEELGRMLGVSAATINARLTKARKLLRGRLERVRSGS